MDKAKLKALIVGEGKWSEAYTKMFEYLINSDIPVSVRGLSRIIAPDRFKPGTFISINAILKVRGLPVRLEMVERRRGCEWEELEVRIVPVS